MAVREPAKAACLDSREPAQERQAAFGALERDGHERSAQAGGQTRDSGVHLSGPADRASLDPGMAPGVGEGRDR